MDNRVAVPMSLLLLLLAGASGKAQVASGHSSAAYLIERADALQWIRAGGVQMAILSGHPDKPGPFAIRLRIKDGYRVMPHWHPRDEAITVINGTFLLGIGGKFNPSALRGMPAGTYALIPKNVRHFASSAGETVIQVQGEGPFDSNYVNPSDAPKKVVQ